MRPLTFQYIAPEVCVMTNLSKHPNPGSGSREEFRPVPTRCRIPLPRCPCDLHRAPLSTLPSRLPPSPATSAGGAAPASSRGSPPPLPAPVGFFAARSTRRSGAARCPTPGGRSDPDPLHQPLPALHRHTIAGEAGHSPRRRAAACDVTVG